LVVVNFLDKRFEYLDPLGGRGIEEMTMIHQWLKYEHLTRLKKEWDDAGWTFHAWNPNTDGVPKQTDGFNCGVFVCKAAEYYSAGRFMDYGRRNMLLFRKRMLFEIFHHELHADQNREVIALSDSDSDANGDSDVEMHDALAGTQTPLADDSVPQADPPARSASAETVAPPGVVEEEALLLLEDQISLARAYNEVIFKRDSSLLAEWRVALLTAVAALKAKNTTQSVLNALRALNEAVRKEYDKNLSTAFPPVGSRARRAVEKQFVYAKQQLASKKNSEK